MLQSTFIFLGRMFTSFSGGNQYCDWSTDKWNILLQILGVVHFFCAQMTCNLFFITTCFTSTVSETVALPIFHGQYRRKRVKKQRTCSGSAFWPVFNNFTFLNSWTLSLLLLARVTGCVWSPSQVKWIMLENSYLLGNYLRNRLAFF